ncbi:MAG: hypothetical protein GY737_00335 [Desulfobacteraceae bacterium]|nr:hypothetical protein [Desulfobacteraceae bacterium]
MAKFDIMPFKSPLGGTYETRVGGMTASETFELGEPVMLVNAGTLTEPIDDGTPWPIAEADSGGEIGIACFGPGHNSNTNPKTNAAFASDDEIAYWPANQGTIFITKNFYSDATTAASPALTDIGESYEITSATVATVENWGVVQAAATEGTDVQAIILDVLDTNKSPIRDTGKTGVYVIFTINATFATA